MVEYIPLKIHAALSNLYCCFVCECGFNLHKRHCAVNFIVLLFFTQHYTAKVYSCPCMYILCVFVPLSRL